MELHFSLEAQSEICDDGHKKLVLETLVSETPRHRMARIPLPGTGGSLPNMCKQGYAPQPGRAYEAAARITGSCTHAVAYTGPVRYTRRSRSLSRFLCAPRVCHSWALGVYALIALTDTSDWVNPGSSYRESQGRLWRSGETSGSQGGQYPALCGATRRESSLGDYDNLSSARTISYHRWVRFLMFHSPRGLPQPSASLRSR